MGGIHLILVRHSWSAYSVSTLCYFNAFHLYLLSCSSYPISFLINIKLLANKSI